MTEWEEKIKTMIAIATPEGIFQFIKKEVEDALNEITLTEDFHHDEFIQALEKRGI